MTRLRARRDERGATLLVAIGVVVVLGALSAGVIPFVTSGIKDRGVLDSVRNRQYAADGAVEYAIAHVRGVANVGLGSCGGPDLRDGADAVDGVDIRVDCSNASTLTRGGFLQRNVIFNACVDTGVACTDSTSIVRAQINYQTDGTIVSRTWVQSWSVNQ